MDLILPAACYAWAGLIPNSFVIPRVALIVAGLYVSLLWDRVPRRAFVFLGVLFLATLLSSDPWRSLKGLPTQWSGGLLPTMAYVALLALPSRRPWLATLGLVLSVHALAQQAGADMRLPSVFLPAGRAVAYIGSPVDLGALLAMAAPAVPVLGLPLIALGLWASGSRAAWAAAAIALLPARAPFKIALALALPGVLFAMRKPAPKDIARVEIWKIAARSAAAHPWLGTGPETFRETFIAGKTEPLVQAVGPSYLQAHAHNDLLEAASCTGLLGLAAYLLLVLPFLGNPSLLALFVILKFNPVPFEVFAAAAMIAANEWRKKSLTAK